MAQPAHTSGAVAWPTRLRQRPRCSVPSGESTGERRRLHRAWWGSRVLTRDGRRWWGGGNDPTRWRSKAVAELQWPGRASTSPVAGGGDGGGEAWSKRGGRQGHGRAHQGGATMVWRHEDSMAAAVQSAGADTRLRKERRGRWSARARAREEG
jgi:hypothetical protein